MILASELRGGMAVRIEGQVYKVLEAEAKAGTAKLGGVVRAKLRNVDSGRMWEPHFRPDEHLEDLELDRHNMEFLFSSDDGCTFMNTVNFEQVEVPRSLLGDAEKFLQPGVAVPVEFFDGRPISVALPDVVEAKVAETAPPIHSGQENTWKDAILENGVRIQVPLFIAAGETVRIDVRSVRYIERVRLEKKKGA